MTILMRDLKTGKLIPPTTNTLATFRTKISGDSSIEWLVLEMLKKEPCKHKDTPNAKP